MTKDDARKIVGTQPKTCLANMAMALSLTTWHNTPDDWRRLEAAVTLLGKACPKRPKLLVQLRREMGMHAHA